jgi:LCP family protein required for cell wall assembly
MLMGGARGDGPGSFSLAAGPPPSGKAAAAVQHGRHRKRPTRRKRWITALVVVSGVLAAVVGGVIGAVTWTTNDAGSRVDRLPDALPAGDRPPAPAETTTFLLVGVDTAAGAGSGAVPETVMLVRVPADRARPQVVYLPPGLGGADELGSYSADDLLDAGGTVEFVESVESLTGVRIDHVSLLDFEGFQAMTDAVGGVTVDVAEPYRNLGHDFPAGTQRLDGEAALAYVRSSGGEARARAGDRQQQMVQALFERVSEMGALSDLGRLTGTVSSLTGSLRVDETLDNADLVALAWDLRAAGSPVFVTAPTDERAEALWEYLRTDSLQSHLDEFR